MAIKVALLVVSALIAVAAAYPWDPIADAAALDEGAKAGKF